MFFAKFLSLWQHFMLLYIVQVFQSTQRDFLIMTLKMLFPDFITFLRHHIAQNENQ